VNHLGPIYIYLTHQRVDKNLNGCHFFIYRYDGGEAKVQDSFAVTKRKVETGK